ncbi:hypothetical protein HA402_012979 [Bradysia odoriphaga]|nr:hypothetical protein HA402_012979 [Bradysia odoriphaga]
MSAAPRTSNDLVEEIEVTENADQNRKTKNFVHELFVTVSKMWSSAFDTIDEILENIGAYVFLDTIAKQLAKHPFLAFGISALIISITLPFIIFLIFAIATVIMTFFGFVIVEGTLITIASVLLFGFLGSVVILFVLFGSVLLAGYFGFMQIYDLIYPKNLYIKFRQPHRHSHAHIHHQYHTRTLDGHN